MTKNVKWLFKLILLFEYKIIVYVYNYLYFVHFFFQIPLAKVESKQLSLFDTQPLMQG